MNPSLTNEWPIKHRADACARTQRPFEPGEQFYTLLFREGDGFRREDLSEEAWAQRNENIRPFSFWKSRYEPPPAQPPEPLPQENAEDLLRRLLAQNDPATANACYVLAVMLERKRVLKQIKTEQNQARPVLVYEHAKSGDVFLVPDVHLRLDEIEHVQHEVSQLLKNAT
jgi:ribosome-binding factor A